ncbi:mannose-6-phosphate isomerase-like protein (cupin superfamily) [Allocatelliglobosispora scoriae]|uniref:Mannose-6-phosphate isomerase-like protein (Cupin superfamily) n=1 Tax=Allocatelliglobosispora scoriae TaxID=643052 RepID=A0A841C4I5_9ACTN|nr:cupin domain-containing protein [Allocatelliglobosispora scoriae]MBB5873880.1 mannose-6-phosphate isomerase-like protein (cupin superfamily) [Allocatelliglobosispora scoriae]
MHLITATTAPRFQLPGVEFTGLASPSRGSGEVCTWRITVEAGLVSDQPHHLDRDEVFMVTSGTLRLSPDGDPLHAGDAAVVPAGEPIQLVNPGAEPATAHVVIQAGFTATMADGTVVGTPPWAV